jgi:H+/Cl- antiporter ClcA
LLSTITVAITADFISKLVFGLEPVFHIAIYDIIPLNQYWLIMLLGVLLGGCGAFYNQFLLKTIAFYKKITAYNNKLRLLVPFLVAGILGITFPVVIGSGHHIIDSLSLTLGIKWLLLVLVAKFLFSMISFGSGAPGGIFFPLLVIGSLIGAIFGSVAINWYGINPALFNNFIVLAMAGYFAAIVRAPITGIILLTEMTGSFSQLLPLTLVSIIAYIVADLLKSAPIYESLLKLLVKDKIDEYDEQNAYKKIIVEAVVQIGSKIENLCLKDLALPDGSLVIAIRRNDQDITPGGRTEIKAEDHLMVLTSLKEEANVREMLHEIADCE